MSFKLKTIIFFLLASLIPYTITMLIFGASLREEQRSNVETELKTQITMTINRIEQQLQTLRNDLVFMSKSEVMTDIFTDDLDRRISRLLQDKKSDLKLIGDFHLVNREKMIIASSDFSLIGHRLTDDATYAADVFSPFDNTKIATLIVIYDLRNLERLFSSSEHRQYHVINHQGDVLFHKKKFDETIMVGEPLHVLPGVSVVLEEDKTHAYQLLKKYQFWFFVTLLIGTIFILIVSMLFASNLIKPLMQLSNAAKDITRSQDYTVQVPIDRTDEIGQMGESFNTMINGIKQAVDEINSLSQEIEDTQREVVFTMGAIGESRSKETGNHVKRVAEYSRVLALKYGLSDEEAEMLKQASPMHDIGKVAIPDAILNKPGKFTDEEFEYMKKHAELGYEMLRGSGRPLLKAAAIVAYEHHEKWNGSGYPRGLAGEEIHIYGRITALADVFDALGSDRVYKKAWDDERILSLFKKERGEHFDPGLVDIFFENLDDFLGIRELFKDV